VPINKEILQLMEDGTSDIRNTEKSGNKIEILKTLGERLKPYINSRESFFASFLPFFG